MKKRNQNKAADGWKKERKKKESWNLSQFPWARGTRPFRAYHSLVLMVSTRGPGSIPPTNRLITFFDFGGLSFSLFLSFFLLFFFRPVTSNGRPSERSAQHLAAIPSCYPSCHMWNRWKTTRPWRPADSAPTPLFMTWKTKPSLIPGQWRRRRRRQHRRPPLRWLSFPLNFFTVHWACLQSLGLIYRLMGRTTRR